MSFVRNRHVCLAQLLLAASSAPLVPGQEATDELQRRVEQAIARIQSKLSQFKWPSEQHHVRAFVEDIIRRGAYHLAISRDESMQSVIAQLRDNTIVVNPDYFSLLSDDEAEAMIFHEFTHMLPEQAERLAAAMAIDDILPATAEQQRTAMLAPTARARALRSDYKRLLRLGAKDELDSYRAQFMYMARQAREHGHRNLVQYLEVLAETTRLPTQAELYSVWAEAMRTDRITERLVVGHVLNLAGPQEYPLIRALAADENVDVTSQDAIETWILSWAMHPEDRRPRAAARRRSAVWLWAGAPMLCLLTWFLLRRARSRTAGASRPPVHR